MTAVRRTMTALGLGLIVQRGALLAVTVILAQALGPAGLGRYALAVALGALLAAVAGAGVRVVASRAAVREPERAGGWVRTAVRARLALTTPLIVLAAGVALAWAADPLPLCLGALTALPMAWDQKGLLDAAARTGREVVLDCSAAILHVGLVVTIVVSGMAEPMALLVGSHLLSRGIYATLAEGTLRSLPGYASPPPVRELLRRATLPSVTQSLCGAVQAGDVWLVRIFGGEVAAGLYALALRIASTASLPSSQLTRLLQPHSDRAAVSGDSAATLQRAVRSTGYAVLPLAAGGLVVATPLCGLFGTEFLAADAALRGLLIAVATLHLGWCYSQALFAKGHVRAWGLTLLTGSAVQVAALVTLTPEYGATGGAAAALLGHGAYLALAQFALSRHVPNSLPGAVAPALLLAGLTAAAAAVLMPEGLITQLAGGALAFGGGLYVLELRHTWRSLGTGLTQASGFRSR